MDDHGQAPTREKPVEREKSVEKQVQKERERIKRQEDEVVVNSDESFPASDPPSFNPGITGASDVKKKKH
jgi:hypothetical protein